MELLLHAVVLVSIFSVSLVRGQPYTAGCGVALQDIPNPSSDTCTAFFRCYNNRQYSLRCPLGQAFHFDRARCRAEQEVDCPLQLQRFQAPAVPHYLRSPLAPQEREVEIRVVHVAPGVDPNNLRFFNNGSPVTATRQSGVQRGSHTLIAAQQQQTIQSSGFQQTPILFRSPDGQFVQGLPVQGQMPQGQPPQGQFVQDQPVQGQVFQGQPVQGQIFQGQPIQGQTIQSPQIQSQTVPGLFIQPPAQAQGQIQG